MDEHITQDELDRILKEHPTPHRNKNSNWRGRMERIKAGEPLVLYPEDEKHRHILKCTAYQYAFQYGIKITVRKLIDNGQTKLVIFLA